MIKLLLPLLLLGSFLAAQEEKVTVTIAQKGEIELHAFFMEELVGVTDGLPVVRVSIGKIQMVDGKFKKRLAVTLDDKRMEKNILRDNPSFRVYIAPDQVGLNKYIEDPAGKTRGRGIYLKALPIERDDRLRDMIDNAKNKSSLESILEMSLDDAMKASNKEVLLNKAIEKMKQMEIDILKNALEKKTFIPFFIVTKSK